MDIIRVISIGTISLFASVGLSFEFSNIRGYKETSFKFLHKSNSKPIPVMDGFQQMVNLKPGLYSGIRSFSSNQHNYNLIVSDATLDTFVVKSSILLKKLNMKKVRKKSSTYEKIKAQGKAKMVSDLSHLAIKKNKPIGDARFSITIDLCPSRKKWDDDLFQSLIGLSTKRLRNNSNPLPVGIAITGRWIKQNQKSFNKLKAWHLKGMLDITWINHSFSHPLRPNQFKKYEFMTASNVSLEREALRLEKILLNEGLIPSIWFRFPGLAFNQKRLTQLGNLGLIPLGSNAWIAKGQRIRDGSVVLLHGNGNERPGVDKFLHYLKKNADNSALHSRVSSLQLLDLP